MDFAIVGVILGTFTYISYMGFYWMYLPKKFRHWFEKSNSRVMLVDLALTVFGTMAFAKLSDSLTAVIAGCTLGFLGTCTSISIISLRKLNNWIKQKEICHG